MSRWRDYLVTLVVAVLLALFVRTYVVTAYKVPTGSMQPTLKPGDFIFSSRMSYGYRLPLIEKPLAPSMPERGDLVVFNYPQQKNISYVKRVVGLPGDRVQIVDGRLIINEVPVIYEKVSVSPQKDNPNAELFEIFVEKIEDHSHSVIFQKENAQENFGPLVVPPDEIFLLGDNRDASDDSRYWGTVPVDHLIGKVFLVWLSLDWQTKWGGERYPSVRWNRVFSSVQ